MHAVLHTIKIIFQKHKYLSIILLLINISLGILPLISVYFVQSIINNIVRNGSFAFVSFLFLLYILVSILSSILSSFQSYINGKISNYLSLEMEYEVLNKVSTLSLSEFENEKTYSEIDKLTNEAPSKPYEVFSSLNTMLISFVTLISGYIYIFNFNKLFALLLFIITCISTPYLLYMGKEQFTVHWDRTESERKNWYIKYIMTHDFSVKEIIFYNLQNDLKEKFVKLKKSFIKQDLHLLKKYSLFSFIYDLGTTIISGFLILGTIKSIIVGKALIGTLTSITQIISLTEEHTRTLISSLYTMRYNLMLLQKLYDFIGTPSDNQVSENSKLFLENVNTISVRNLSFSYGTKPVLYNLNFELHRGMLVALVGTNGSGKSTLVKLLSGLYSTNNSDEILINGIDISKYDKSTLHNKISILFQDYVKYEMSLRENIGFGNLSDINDDLKLENVIKKYANSLPKDIKLDDQLGNWFSDGKQLSGGQWQSIATSRAFFNNKTDFVILDEPNSALDSLAEKKLFTEFKKFVSKSKLGLFVSHRIGAIKQADLIIVLDHGHLIATGTHEQLIKNCKVYQELERAEKYE
ncbi:ABC transporter ATP-binding protein [Lactobacillus helsingborgensis]|uniref:ABC transporter ATP-binding protein n=1 Tax=Lactobacillus helsingborgensis TaxID=1218494 RepID=UPI001650052D|nr:ABC transporter ATP-binding protein [Lactobacillus helsingborgensis]MBC6356684.1 ABC transporter ATP-binding protein [Lactobacillus helsingborgensis]